jgi:catechol 2,3-dioxygenase-like lactoylglutathione lyase family enzyme
LVVRVPPERDQRGEWLERASGVPRAHLRGTHLRLPGGGPDGPTLEIYAYSEVLPKPEPLPNRAGFGHLAFSVKDVDAALRVVVAEGGRTLGEVVSKEVPGVGTLRFTYARDPEGNILELQNWS